MCKHLPLIVCLFAICSAQLFNRHVVQQIFIALDKNLDYLLRHYDHMNEDCLFGVLLAKEFLSNIPFNEISSKKIKLMPLVEKLNTLYTLSSKYLKIHSKQSWTFDLLMQPELWRRNISFKNHTLNREFIPNRFVILNLIKASEEGNQYGTFSDCCLQNLLELTRDLNEEDCDLDVSCQNEFINNHNIKPGYFATHMLLYLQAAKQRNCTVTYDIYEDKVKKICDYILKELRNVDYFGHTGEAFDLFLEQIVLCGSEGFSEFLKLKWLILTLKAQKRSGCFPAHSDSGRSYRYKRNINEWDDGCADHTTGLGTAVLSLYLNYLLRAK